MRNITFITRLHLIKVCKLLTSKMKNDIYFKIKPGNKKVSAKILELWEEFNREVYTRGGGGGKLDFRLILASN